ncbi:ribosomal protection-like ABC-F family protein [Gorillibacterium sp. sgz500922]|uniref:ribosomal protection-like ABC-F family protein n=1 Tax=Gorillibacterium sp. sgz500922 TaxID=3446694 RepID=UPI003F67DD69
MMVLEAKDLCKEWEGRTLFRGVRFEIAEGERIALVGRNGIGKTTLLLGLAGRHEFEGGSVTRGLPLPEWGLLEQQAAPGESISAREFVLSGTPQLYERKQRLDRLLAQLTERADDSVVADYGQAYEAYLDADGYGWEQRADRCLTEMGVAPGVWNLPFAALSGGQKTKVQLARLLLREPGFLLLDEPTNHLDEDTLDALEAWLGRYPGTVLYVSHDREFIDRTATAVLELAPDGCRKYPGGYSRYREAKERERRTQEALCRKQELEREKLLESIRRYAEWFRQAHRAAGQNDFRRSKSKKNVSRLHAKETALQRLDRDRTAGPRDEPGLNMRLVSAAFEAGTLLRFARVGFAYPDGPDLFREAGFTLARGDRLAVLGPNGTGKSTLLRLAAGRLAPTQGEVSRHPEAKIGYFSQELSGLPFAETILDSLLVLPGMTETQARTLLGCFLFPREDAFKRIADLSMGEKCRVAFLRLFFGQANLLVLDEPTNYLDIPTRERVEEAIREYPGTVLLVSHDRYFVRRTATRLALLDGGGSVRLFEGSYAEYEERGGGATFSPEEQRRANERGLLELKLARLIGGETPEDEEARIRLTEEIRETRQALEALRGEEKGPA